MPGTSLSALSVVSPVFLTTILWGGPLINPILQMGTLRSEMRNSPRSHSSEVGNWELNGHLRDFIVWAPNLLSLWSPLYLPWLCLSDYKISKRSRGGDLTSPGAHSWCISEGFLTQDFSHVYNVLSSLRCWLFLKCGGIASWMMYWPHQYLCWALEYSQNSAWHVAQWLFVEWMNTHSLISIQLLDTRSYDILL